MPKNGLSFKGGRMRKGDRTVTVKKALQNLCSAGKSKAPRNRSRQRKEDKERQKTRCHTIFEQGNKFSVRPLKLKW